ncbi:MAG: hypothetical protein GEV08_02605 [Acidimicrobiia bacterium]|nr:hypothetical protein [Acidimicrobiia bacterium]
MLQFTQTAASVLQGARSQQGLPDTYGVRVFAAKTAEDEMALQIGFAEVPAEGDHVARQHEPPLFISGEIAEQLSDVEIDVVPDPSSDGQGAPQLVLRPQSGETA